MNKGKITKRGDELSSGSLLQCGQRSSGLHASQLVPEFIPELLPIGACLQRRLINFSQTPCLECADSICHLVAKC